MSDKPSKPELPPCPPSYTDAQRLAWYQGFRDGMDHAININRWLDKKA